MPTQSPTREQLIQKFNQAVDRIVEECRSRKWNEGGFYRMYHNYNENGYEMTLTLVRSHTFRKGMFAENRQMKRKDLSVEYLVALPEYRELFTEDDVKIAEFRVEYED